MFGISAFSQAPFSTLGAGAVLLGQASVTADATVSADSLRIRTFDASFNGTATVTVTLSGSDISASATILSVVNVDCSGLRVRTSTSSITSNASVDIDYLRIREPIQPAIPFTAIGDAQLSTAQQKFGTASLKTDGSGDRIVSTSPINFATGDFTIEFWVYSSAITSSTAFIFDNRNVVSANGGVYVRLLSGNLYVGYNTTNVFNIAHGLTNNAWHHIALSRSGTTWRLFTNGSLLTSATSTSISFSGNVSYIGGVGISSFNGHMDEVRLSDTARYTSAFTPSTSAFTPDVNAKALLHFDGTNGSTTMTNSAATSLPAISANANVSAFANRLVFLSGAITVNAQTEVDYIRIRLNDGSITTLATVSALGGVVYDGTGNVNAIATVQTLGGIVKHFVGYINANGTMTAIGYVLGEEWTDTPYGSESWTNITAGTEVWTEVNAGNETWLRKG